MRFWRGLRKLLAYVLLAIVLVTLGVYLNHRLALSREANDLSPIGNRVEVEGKQLNVYVTGSGSKTLVLLAGGGTTSPILDFKALTTQLAPDYRIVIVERLGYGFSDDGDSPRDIETVNRQTRQALQASGIQGPYVLVAHSMAGLEALYWAQEHPEEISAIVGLDMAMPQSYDKVKVPTFVVKVGQMLLELGYGRFLYPAEKAAPALESGHLTPAEIANYKALFYKQALTTAIGNELEMSASNAKQVLDKPLPSVPILLYVSNASGTSFSSEAWYQMAQDSFGQVPNATIKRLDVGHYVHDYAPEEIAAGIGEFLKANN